MKFVVALHLACISVMLMFQTVSTQPHSTKRQEVEKVAAFLKSIGVKKDVLQTFQREKDCVTVTEDLGGWSLCDPPRYVKGFWRNDPQQDSYPSSLRCDAAITSYDSCRCEEICHWHINSSKDPDERYILCPNASFVWGLYFPSTGNRYFTQIYCCTCRPLNQPESNEECYFEDVFSPSLNRDGMSECQREGYFITGFYEKSYDFFSRIERFKCCKMTDQQEGPETNDDHR